jgi:hypothetical protein
MKSDDENAALRTFGGTAGKLSQNPLGIIALFIVLVYAFASIVAALGRNLTEYAMYILVWFLAVFPVMVLVAFTWLVSKHHTKLYAPKDYQNASDFVVIAELGVNNFKSVQSQLPSPETVINVPIDEYPMIEIPAESAENSILSGESKVAVFDPIFEMEREREKIYRDNRFMVLVHELTPSSKPGFKYDISIYAKRHKRRGGSDDIFDVVKAEFYFGKSFGGQIFTGQRKGDVIGVTTSAYGTFLCICRITFEDGEKIMIHRFIDFEMGDVVQKILEKGVAG